jgi:cobalt transporter subunit CbtB
VFSNLIVAKAMVPGAVGGENASKPLKGLCGNTGRDASHLRIVPHAQRQNLREGEEVALAHASAWAWNREPGDLPDNTGAFAPTRLILASSTEVVMAHSAVSTQSISVSDRLVAGVLALLLGSFLIFGAGFAHSSVLHDTAHDVRHANGFPCH